MSDCRNFACICRCYQLWLLRGEGKIYEQVNLLENVMLKEDRILPDTQMFEIVIQSCGEVGYASKAFYLYTRVCTTNCAV